MSGDAASRSTAANGRARYTGAIRQVGRMTWITSLEALSLRITSMAAEIAFFALLSMPPLVLALAGAAAWMGAGLDAVRQERLVELVREQLSPFLTEDVVESVMLPTLTTALDTPRYDVISVGFVLALWSGSRAMGAAYVSMSLIGGVSPREGVWRLRLVSFGLYLLALVLSALGLPLLVIGPDLAASVLPEQWGIAITAYWVGVAVVFTGALTTIYRLAARSGNWFTVHLPGAVLALLLGLAASWGLRTFLAFSLGSSTSMSIYGPLTAPIVILLWLYLLAAALLIGVVFNRVLKDERFRRHERALAKLDAWE